MFSLSVFKCFIFVSNASFCFSSNKSCWVDLCRCFSIVIIMSFKFAFSLFKAPAIHNSGVRNPSNFLSTNSRWFLIPDFGSCCRRHLAFRLPSFLCIYIGARAVKLKTIKPSPIHGFTSIFSGESFLLFRGLTFGALNFIFWYAV